MRGERKHEWNPFVLIAQRRLRDWDTWLEKCTAKIVDRLPAARTRAQFLSQSEHQFVYVRAISRAILDLSSGSSVVFLSALRLQMHEWRQL